MAPTTRKGSAPATTASGKAVSGGSWEKSCSQAKLPDERTATFGHVIADRSAKDRIGALECVQDGRHSGPSRHVNGHFSLDARERSEMCRKLDSNHRDLG